MGAAFVACSFFFADLGLCDHLAGNECFVVLKVAEVVVAARDLVEHFIFQSSVTGKIGARLSWATCSVGDPLAAASSACMVGKNDLATMSRGRRSTLFTSGAGAICPARFLFGCRRKLEAMRCALDDECPRRRRGRRRHWPGVHIVIGGVPMAGITRWRAFALIPCPPRACATIPLM